MKNPRKSYNTYSREFKLEAVRLMESSEKSSAELALELGIRRNMLYKWKEQLISKGDQAFSGKAGRPEQGQESELTKLRADIKRLQEENTILKKAAAYFAKDLS